MTAAYNFPEEGLKHIQWRNAHTVSKFFYTFKMIHSYFVDQLQDINKVMMMIMILVMKMVLKLMMMTRQQCCTTQLPTPSSMTPRPGSR